MTGLTRHRSLIVILWLFCRPLTGLAENASDRETAQSIFQGMQVERKKIEFGIVEFTASKSVSSSEYGEKKELISGSYIFASQLDFLRFENLERSLAPEESFLRRLSYIRNRDYSASWTKTGSDPRVRNDVYLRKPDAPLGGALVSIHRLHDLRSTGLFDFHLFQENSLSGIEIEKVLETYLKHKLVGIRVDQAMTTMMFENQFVRWTLKVETDDGFRPVELIETTLDSNTTEDTLNFISKTRWANPDYSRLAE